MLADIIMEKNISKRLFFPVVAHLMANDMLSEV